MLWNLYYKCIEKIPANNETTMKWSKYAFEFLSIFIAVISAFALNSWNDNRRDAQAATKILTEISNGLDKDLKDIEVNIYGHKQGINACKYWRNILSDKDVDTDSLMQYYFGLTRDFFSMQNNSGYETLKSRGLELIKDDSLRFDIISLYEYDYGALKTMEENYFEMQFQENYFQDFNNIMAPLFKFDDKGNMIAIATPIQIKEADRKILLSYLWKIQMNRRFILSFYANMDEKIKGIKARIEESRL